MAKNSARAAGKEEQAAEASLGLDDGIAAAESAGPKTSAPAADLQKTAAAGRQGDGSRPFCCRHNCLMKAEKSDPLATHYACPVPGCSEKEKKARPAIKVPAEPMRCTQRVHGLEKEGSREHFLEVNDELSTLANLHMECPGCGFHVKVPRPQFTPQMARQQAAAADGDFGER